MSVGTISLDGFEAEVILVEEVGLLMGKVINARDVITFYAASLPDLKAEFRASLDEYFKLCEERGLAPGRAYSGRFNLRIAPTLHARAQVAAARRGLSLNALVERAIAHEIEDDEQAA